MAVLRGLHPVVIVILIVIVIDGWSAARAIVPVANLGMGGQEIDYDYDYEQDYECPYAPQTCRAPLGRPGP